LAFVAARFDWSFEVGKSQPMSGVDTQRPSAIQKCELLVYTRQELQLFPLNVGSVVEIGRGPTSSIHLEENLVSRQHARLYVGDEAIEVEDLGSANGTALVRNSTPREMQEDDTQLGAHERLTPHVRVRMVPGDALRISAAILVLQNKQRSSSSDLRGIGSPGTSPVLADPEMRQAYELATRAATSDISILILGETGVGKEVMAETIHRRSRRAARSFLKLNCAALPETLLESELFGHEKGAFTGAQTAKVGLLEANDRGTIFLDEIGELPLGTQAKLLRVLEDGSVMRVGATKTRQVDVRFITATNRELGREVRAGRFRSDLYYRISGVVTRIPPLRRRVSEIEPLAFHFLREFCARTGQPKPALADAALTKLRSHHWPGNVRELRNVMQRAALVGTEKLIGPEHILLETSEFESIPPPVAAEPEDTFDDEFEAVTKVLTAPDLTVPGDERARIQGALEMCGGNQTRAAKLLGVSRRTLINRLEKFDLPRPKKC
jgi:two-component system response regulator AtoC